MYETLFLFARAVEVVSVLLRAVSLTFAFPYVTASDGLRLFHGFVFDEALPSLEAKLSEGFAADLRLLADPPFFCCSRSYTVNPLWPSRRFF